MSNKEKSDPFLAGKKIKKKGEKSSTIAQLSEEN